MDTKTARGHPYGRMLTTLVLALALVATLGIAAAPALAQDGCDCHTAVPPTASAAHAPYVASVTDCTVCHADWVVPHPDAGRSTLLLSGRSIETGFRLSGWIGVAFGGLTPTKKPHPGVVVYLQQRLWDATGFTDLTQATTGSKGGVTFTVASPPPFATYRAVSQGHVGAILFGNGTALFRPRTTTLLPTPELTLAIQGLRPGGLSSVPSARLGRTLTVEGTVAPADLGGKVTIRVQRWVRHEHKWVTRLTMKRAISATGTYSWTWTPRHRGAFRVAAIIPATDAYRGVLTRWAWWGGHFFQVR